MENHTVVKRCVQILKTAGQYHCDVEWGTVRYLESADAK